jgi:hypothetical protein
MATNQPVQNPTIRIQEIALNEDYVVPEGYALSELKTSTSKGKGLFYAVLVRTSTIPPKKANGNFLVPKP